MALLNQILAIEKGAKSQAYSTQSDMHKLAQKTDLFEGFSKTYQSLNEEGETLPAEAKKVQQNVPDILEKLVLSLQDYWTVTARKDWTNCEASANIFVDGHVLLENVPVTYLLFLEKQILDVRTFVEKLPVLDPNQDWTRDENSGLFKTTPVQTHRTRKINRPLVLYAATPEHPAQTQLVTEDVLAGYWSNIKYSGAIPAPLRAQLLSRVEALYRAVKMAREAANATEESKRRPEKSGELLLQYIFTGGILHSMGQSQA